MVVLLPSGAGSCGNSSRWHLDEGEVASACHLARLAEVDPVGRLAVVVADEDLLSRPGVKLAEVPLVMKEATGPDSLHKIKVGVFAEHTVVQCVAIDGFVRQAIE